MTISARPAAETTLTAHTAPPLLNQDGEQIRQWLGLLPASAGGADAGVPAGPEQEAR